ncbi:MAG TPA: hypothetical protein VMF10_16270, partial [Candidatus Aquilonibacter sp.]|nr:hypothetical protein [Candidatus Aquilonibacter sp.]
VGLMQGHGAAHAFDRTLQLQVASFHLREVFSEQWQGFDAVAILSEADGIWSTTGGTSSRFVWRLRAGGRGKRHAKYKYDQKAGTEHIQAIINEKKAALKAACCWLIDWLSPHQK